MLYGIVQNGLLLVGKFYGVVYFGCTVCHGDSFRALRERYYRLDTKNLTSSYRVMNNRFNVIQKDLDVLVASAVSAGRVSKNIQKKYQYKVPDGFFNDLEAELAAVLSED